LGTPQAGARPMTRPRGLRAAHAPLRRPGGNNEPTRGAGRAKDRCNRKPLAGRCELAYMASRLRDGCAGAAAGHRSPRGSLGVEMSHPRVDGAFPAISSWAATARRTRVAAFRNLLDRCTAKRSIILEVLLDETVVGGPTHLRGFGRNPPIIQIRRTEFRLQLGPTDAGLVNLTAELRTVGKP